MSSRVQTAVTMRQVTGSMTNVVKGMDQAMRGMDLEKVGSFPFTLLIPGVLFTGYGDGGVGWDGLSNQSRKP